jgi:hypothetical protein
MAENEGSAQQGGAEVMGQKKKMMLAAFQAKQSRSLAPESIEAMNIQLQAARRPIVLADADPTDHIIIFDLDPTDRVIRI